MDNVELIFQPEALDAIAAKAVRKKAGARGLRSVIEGMMTDIMFEIPDLNGKKGKCVIDASVVNGERKAGLQMN